MNFPSFFLTRRLTRPTPDQHTEPLIRLTRMADITTVRFGADSVWSRCRVGLESVFSRFGVDVDSLLSRCGVDVESLWSQFEVGVKLVL